MKKLVFFNLATLLLFLPSQNLNLNSLMAEPTSCIENNSYISKIIDSCQNNTNFAQEIMSKICKKVRDMLMRICTLPEKLELRSFTKTPTLFEKLFSEFIRNISSMLNIEKEKIQTFTKTIQLPNQKSEINNKSNFTQFADKSAIENLVDEILYISGDKLDCSISLVMQFLKPSSNEQIDRKQIKSILIQTLSNFTTEEIKALEKVIRSNAFAKIANKLDELTGMVLSIIREEDTKITVK